MSAKACVLIVENDGADAALLEDGFGKANYRLLRAHDLRQALQILDEAGGCDVIVIGDIAPRTNGIELLKRLKSAPRYSGIPVMMKSAADTPRELMEAMQAGAGGCFAKPFDAEVIVRAVSKLLKREENNASLSLA